MTKEPRTESRIASSWVELNSAPEGDSQSEFRSLRSRRDSTARLASLGRRIPPLSRSLKESAGVFLISLIHT